MGEGRWVEVGWEGQRKRREMGGVTMRKVGNDVSEATYIYLFEAGEDYG